MELTHYYEDICKQYPPLSKEEEVKLLTIYYAKDSTASQKKAARDTLICSNLRYVFKKARRYSKGNVEQFEELIASGNEGLIVGLEKFDFSRDMRLLTYAGWWVMQRQLKEMSRWRLVALPMQKQQLASKIKKLVDANEDTPLSFEDLKAAFPEASDKDLRELSSTQFLTFYIEGMHDSELPLIDPIEDLIDTIEDQQLHDIIDRYAHPDNMIMKLSCGLVDGVEKRPAEVVRLINEPDVDIAYVKEVIRRISKKIEEVIQTQ